jgi:hypothetical protein
VTRYFVGEYHLFKIAYEVYGRVLTVEERNQIVAMLSKFAVGTCPTASWC